MPGATAPLLRAVNARYLPTLALHVVDPARPVPAVAAEVLAARAARGEAAAYLCQRFSCQPPVGSVAALEALLPVPTPGHGVG